MNEDAGDTTPIKVFLLDDHEIVRRGVKDLLEAEPDITVIGEAGTAASALARIPALRPDVAVLDVRLPDGDGVSVCRDIRSQMPGVACLMLTSFGDDEALFDAIMAGAAGYVLKQIRGTDLVGAVRTVAAGQSLLDPEAAARVMARMRDQSRRADPLAGADRPGAEDPRADRRGPDEPADRRAIVPRGEDRQELRVSAFRQARHGAAHAGRRVRGQDFRRAGSPGPPGLRALVPAPEVGPAPRHRLPPSGLMVTPDQDGSPFACRPTALTGTWPPEGCLGRLKKESQEIGSPPGIRNGSGGGC